MSEIDYEQEYDNLKDKYSDLEDVVYKLRENAQDFENKIEELKDTVIELEQENKSLERQNDEFNSRIGELEDEVVSLELENSSLEEDLKNQDDFEKIINQAKRIQSYKRGEFVTFNFDEELDELIELILDTANG